MPEIPESTGSIRSRARSRTSRSRCPTGAQPLVSVAADDVGRIPVDVDDAEALNGVDDQQAVADPLTDLRQVGDSARAEVDEADGDRGDVVIERLRDGIRVTMPATGRSREPRAHRERPARGAPSPAGRESPEPRR
jgi:hypothetical protein